jgi:23S rRNA (adenine2503-C2)-methyltransferase
MTSRLNIQAKISVFSHTQASYASAVQAAFGKGREHAKKLYSEWFQRAKVSSASPWVEKTAGPLVEEIIASTDFSLPHLSLQKQEEKTLKFLLKYEDFLESESVLIAMESGTTLCISSQIGCKMGCAFCETGRMGLLRHLSAKEIVSQVFYAVHVLGRPVRNIVFMGMGEPLDNFKEVMQAITILIEPAGFGFGPSRITISTSGLVPEIYKLIDEAHPAINLAVSVNASNDLLRNRLMPVNKKWNMEKLKEAMKAYCKHPRRQILIEYVLLKDVNDSLSCAEELGDYLKDLSVKINLIPYNPQGKDRFAPTSQGQIQVFSDYLRQRGYQVLVRHSKGQRIMAACGQLGDLRQRLTMISSKKQTQILRVE